MTGTGSSLSNRQTPPRTESSACSKWRCCVGGSRRAGDSYCDVAGRQIFAEYLAGSGLKAIADP